MTINHQSVIRARSIRNEAEAEPALRERLEKRFGRILDKIGDKEAFGTSVNFALEKVEDDINRQTAPRRGESASLRLFVTARHVDGARLKELPSVVERFDPRSHLPTWALLWSSQDWDWRQLEDPWPRDLILFGAPIFPRDWDVHWAFHQASGISLHQHWSALARFFRSEWQIEVHGWPSNDRSLRGVLDEATRNIHPGG